MSLHFSQVLHPEHIDLRLAADSQQDAVEVLLGMLREDQRVEDPEALAKAVLMRNAPALCENGIGLCIAHGRTNSLSSLVMAAGRLARPAPLSGEFQGQGELHLVFVAGIPASLNADYLRLVGAIARICSKPGRRDELLDATSPQAFIEILEEGLNPL